MAVGAHRVGRGSAKLTRQTDPFRRPPQCLMRFATAALAHRYLQRLATGRRRRCPSVLPETALGFGSDASGSPQQRVDPACGQVSGGGQREETVLPRPFNLSNLHGTMSSARARPASRWSADSGWAWRRDSDERRTRVFSGSTSPDIDDASAAPWSPSGVVRRSGVSWCVTAGSGAGGGAAVPVGGDGVCGVRVRRPSVASATSWAALCAGLTDGFRQVVGHVGGVTGGTAGRLRGVAGGFGGGAKGLLDFVGDRCAYRLHSARKRRHAGFEKKLRALVRRRRSESGRGRRDSRLVKSCRQQ